MSELFYIIFLPVSGGLLLFFIPDKTRIFKIILSLIIGIFALIYSIQLFISAGGLLSIDLFSGLVANGSAMHKMLLGANNFCLFNVDNLSKFIVLCISAFTLIILVYSAGYFSGKKSIHHNYSFILLTQGFTAGAALTDNLILFIGFWGILGITLYKLIHPTNAESSSLAKKTLVLIGASDGIMILGIAILWKSYGTLSMSALEVNTAIPLMAFAFLFLMIGSFTKAGAFPFHTWVPGYSKYAPASSAAYLPASLDKLLGIYFLTRLCTKIFCLNEWLTFLMLLLGVCTIIFAVMMALIQHNYKQLLGYHAVSQVGYMIVGLALGSPLGIAGGLFHMINNAIYKSGLFLSAGNIEKITGKENLDDLGGLSKAMPLTFISALICALAISGVPPLNGFASKWLIYQGIIDFGKGPGFANHLWILWLGLAVLGSALTLASFLKYISGSFLGPRNELFIKAKEVGFLMWLPVAFLALTCVVFGIFASSWVIPKIIMPLTGKFVYTGIWDSSTAGFLILASIILGILIYLPGRTKRFRTDEIFLGGEIPDNTPLFPVTEFYKTIREFKLFSMIYKQAERKWFDIYDLSRRVVLWTGEILSDAHTGVLSFYAFWMFIGLITLLVIFLF